TGHNADVVLGSRYINGIRIINWPLKRLMLSKSAANYVRIITGMPFTDPTGGYKCFRRRALEAIDLDEVRSNGYSFQIEMTHKIWRQGLKVVEVPIVFTDRFQGSSKMSKRIVREAFLKIGRASCRERVYIAVGEVALKKKKEKKENRENGKKQE